MKTYIKILFFLSICLNVYMFYDQKKTNENVTLENSLKEATGGVMNKTQWDIGVKTFIEKLNLKSKALAGKKYYYISTWTNWCKPCLAEMPMLDSLMNRANDCVACTFVTDISDNAARYCLKQNHLNPKNFIFLNDMNNFISALFNELKIKNKIYPVQLIIDQQGKVFYYQLGAFEGAKDASKLIKILKELK